MCESVSIVDVEHQSETRASQLQHSLASMFVSRVTTGAAPHCHTGSSVDTTTADKKSRHGCRGETEVESVSAEYGACGLQCQQKHIH